MGTPADAEVAAVVLPELMGDAAVAEAVGSTAATAGAAEAGTGAALSGVEAVNAAAPGSIAMGLSDSEVAGSVFAPAAAGGAAGAVAADTLGGPATTSTGAAAPDSATKALANQTLESGLGEPTGQYGGPTGQPLPGGDGLIDKFTKLDPRIQAAAIQAGGLGVAGAAGGVGKVLAEQRKADLELQNKKNLSDFYRTFLQGNTSVGGGGVSVNIRPGIVGSRI